MHREFDAERSREERKRKRLQESKAKLEALVQTQTEELETTKEELGKWRNMDQVANVYSDDHLRRQ